MSNDKIIIPDKGSDYFEKGYTTPNPPPNPGTGPGTLRRGTRPAR